jgi:carboxyl-terminal processing protease
MKKTILIVICLFSFEQIFCQNSSPFLAKLKTLRAFLQKQHYAPIIWNDDNSSKLFKHWLQYLDEDKTLFLQTEVDALKQYENKLDDVDLISNELYFKKSVQYFIGAIKRSDSISNIVLNTALDFSKPDELSFPYKQYAKTTSELKQRIVQLSKWRVLRGIADEMEELGKLNATLPNDFTKKEVSWRIKILKRQKAKLILNNRFDELFFKDEEVKYLNANAWCYDPHSNFMDLQAKQNFETMLSGFELSTGLEIEENDEGFTIDKLEPGGSAWRTGELHKGDVIVAVKKGKDAEVEIASLTKLEVEALMNDNSDDDIELTVKTANGNSKKIKINKEKVTDEESIVKGFLIDEKRKIGYISLPDFYSREDEEIKSEKDLKYDGCANDVSKEIVKLKRDNIEGLILDLRFNGGGSMWEAIQLAGIFIDYGPVGSQKQKNGKITFLKDPHRGTAYDGPLLILVNSSSASASELTSAMLQDYKRALIVGSTTFGKGTAQVVLPLDSNYNENGSSNYQNSKDFVKVTTAKFYRIDGSTTQWKGVIPEIALPDFYDSLQIGERKEPTALLPDSAKRGNYQPLAGIPYEMLRQKSRQRVASDSFFKAVNIASSLAKRSLEFIKIPLQWKSYVQAQSKFDELDFLLNKNEDEDEKPLMKVSNHSFDKDRLKFTKESLKETNEQFIKNIASDAYILEAYNIFTNWLETKN